MHIEEVCSSNLLKACREYLARDPITNVLPLGDLYPPLRRVSDITSAIEDDEIVGVCAVYRAFPTPSIVFGAATQEIKKALTKKAVDTVSDKFISLCAPEDSELLSRQFTILQSRSEQQMIALPSKHFESSEVKVERVKKSELENLNSFYAEHNAEAWVPIQFEAGPYYCVKHDCRIVCAAGVHLAPPHIVQLGNIVTDDAYRNRGFATACVSALTSDPKIIGRIMSLFVKTDNAPAIHMYEKLGFRKVREIELIVMQKR